MSMQSRFSKEQLALFKKYYENHADWWVKCLEEDPNLGKVERKYVTEFCSRNLKLKVNKEARMKNSGRAKVKSPGISRIYSAADVEEIGTLDETETAGRFFTAWETAVIKLDFERSGDWLARLLLRAPALKRKQRKHIHAHARGTLGLDAKWHTRGRPKKERPAGKDSLEVADSVLKGYGFV